MTPPTVPPAITPDWLAHRYDPEHDALHFVQADRALRQRVAFLTDEHLPGAAAPVIVRRADAVPSGGEAPVNFVFHSAYCCSTLVANAYDRPGKSFSLKEPVLLNDLVGWRHRGGDPERIRTVLLDALGALARPFEPGEICVIKPSNVVNGLAPAMMAHRPEAAALLLYAPLEAFLGSIASKGLWGRLWVRELIEKQLKEGLVQLGFGPEDIFRQSDLQVAAVGWLAQHALFAKIATNWPDRVRTLNSETLLAHSREALAALDALFGLDDSVASREKIEASVFHRHAKFGGEFDAARRVADQRSAADAHGEEIAMVASWAATVAAEAGVAMELPQPLLPHA